ncbi:MAG: TIGR00366 family protein [Bacteroidota bacterium]
MKFKVPHTLILLFGMIILAQLLTYVIPHGKFEIKEDHGHTTVVPGTFKQLEDSGNLAPFHMFMVIPRGFQESQGIIFFVFIIGGALAVIRRTGTIDAFLGKSLEIFGSRQQGLIVAGMLIFAIGSSTLGMAEEYLPFIAILISLCIALKLDAITAVGIMVVGYGVGYGVAAVNPFTLVIAQEVSGLKPTSGIGYRLILFVPMFLIGWHHVSRYGRKILKNPENSLLHGIDTGHKARVEKYPKMNKRHLIVLLLLIFAVGLIVYGISGLSGWGWYLTEMGAVFLVLAFIIPFIGGIKADEAAKAFTVGAAELTGTALLIGFAKSIALVMEDGEILHSVVYGLSIPLEKMGAELASAGMFFVQSILNFFIPSGSGQAYVSMPIMAPLADLSGISRQVAVLAFQFGDGFTNMLVPTNAVLMGILGIAGIPYNKWFWFIIPLMVKLWIAGSVALVIAVLIGYS